MCDECGCHENGRGLFSIIHSLREREFENKDDVVIDDLNTKMKKKNYEDTPSYDNLLKLASAYCFQLRYKDAYPLYVEAINRIPSHYEAHRKLALVELKLLKLEDAYKEFEYCLERTDDKLDVIYRLGLVSYYSNNYELSLKHFKDAIELSKDNGDMNVGAIYWYALCLLRLNQSISEAIDYYKQFKPTAVTHFGYEICLKLMSEEISLDEAEIMISNISDLQKTCAYYGFFVYYEKIHERRSNMYLKLTLDKEDYWAGFASIAAYIDKKNK